MRKLILAMCLAVVAFAAGAQNPPIDAECAQAVRAAYEAYTMTTFDAKHPDLRKMALALDFRLSQQPFPASERHAYTALGYIARRLRDAGVRAPQDYDVVAAAGEYINKECSK